MQNKISRLKIFDVFTFDFYSSYSSATYEYENLWHI